MVNRKTALKSVRPSELNLVFQAMADATRRDMIQRLARAERTIGQLAEPYEMSMPAITKHVKVLEQAGLIVKRREGKFIHCRLEPRRLEQANQWIEQQRKYWETQLDRFGEFLETKKSQSNTKMSTNKVKSSKKRGKKS